MASVKSIERTEAPRPLLSNPRNTILSYPMINNTSILILTRISHPIQISADRVENNYYRKKKQSFIEKQLPIN